MSEFESRRPVDPVDLLMLGQEDEPRRRNSATAVLCLSSRPNWPDVLARFDYATRISPALRQRLVSPLPGSGPPEWVTDPSFQLTDHVQQTNLPGLSDRSRLLAFAQSSAAIPLPRGRPLWRADLLVDPDVDTAALVIRLSHAIADGLAAVQLLACLVDVADMAAAGEDRVAAEPATTDITTLGLTMERLMEMPLQMQTTALRNTLGLFRIAGATLNAPRGTSAQALKYARSLSRVLSAGEARSSPVLRGRSDDRRHLTLEIPTLALRRAARTAGGSLNDGYLAGVLGGLRHYHELHAEDVSHIPFAVPVSTRSRSRQSIDKAGNRIAAVRFAAPIGIVSAAERIRAVAEIIRAARAEPALDALSALAPAFAQLPSAAVAIAGRAQDRLDVQASFVPGPIARLAFTGIEIDRMFVLGPLPGPAVMAVMFSYAGVCTIGFTIDVAAVTDLDGFENCMRLGFDEVLSLAAG